MPVKNAGVITPFIVRESKIVSIIAFLVFLAMFITSIAYDSSNVSSIIFSAVSLLPGIYFLAKVFNNKKIIEVNESGFYYNEALLTNWDNFISANYDQEEKMLSIQDNFFLRIEYIKAGTGKVYTSKIKLPGTLNKSEEAIIDAIKRFCPNCNR